jgi:hypothetical protein
MRGEPDVLPDNKYVLCSYSSTMYKDENWLYEIGITWAYRYRTSLAIRVTGWIWGYIIMGGFACGRNLKDRGIPNIERHGVFSF